MTLDDNQVCTINAQELHDILSEVISMPDSEGALVRVQEFVLQDADERISPNDLHELAEIVAQLNEVQRKLQSLDGKFHDIFDGMFC